MFCSYH